MNPYTDPMSRRSTDASLDETERDVLKRREEHGWFVNVIAEDEVGPGFAYSFGLYEEFSHPEVIIFGLPNDTMQTLVNDVGNHIRAGTKYSAGDRTNDLIEGYTCIFREVNPVHYAETFTWAMWFYGNRNFPALQLVWPDKHSNEHLKCSATVRGRLQMLDASLRIAGLSATCLERGWAYRFSPSIR